MKKILIIEDDQLVATIYKKKLAQNDFDVETAPDGEQGFALIHSLKPDAVILDLMLPRITGLEVLKQIRADENLKHLPVVVFSNTYLTSMVQEAWKAGATKCLSKANCRPDQLIQIIRGFFSHGPPEAAAGPSVPAATAPLTPASPRVVDADTTFQTDLRESFLASLPKSIAAARAHLQAAAKGGDEATRVQYLEELYRRVHSITGNAGVAGVTPIALMADALEALLKELYEKPKTINASTFRTLASAIDFLGLLLERTPLTEIPTAAPPFKPNILVVDDEAISRRAVTYALEKARLPSVSVESPEIALGLLGENSYDLVILDVDMPGMNGFELCTKLRALHRNKTTPVVFVTSLTDFESRANSTMSGGNDFIAKPFLFMELAVKAMVYVLRGRLAAAPIPGQKTGGQVFPLAQ